jgi:hypothetical protein
VGNGAITVSVQIDEAFGASGETGQLAEFPARQRAARIEVECLKSDAGLRESVGGYCDGKR